MRQWLNHPAPGKYYRQGIGLPELFQLFPDDATAEEWFIANRWPEVLRCAPCGSPNAGREGGHPQIPFPCRDCRKFFSVKTGTVMQSAKLGYQQGALAIYILTTNIKGTSSMKLRRDLGVTQKTAWHLAHRIRQCWQEQTASFLGPVEADETYIGGKEGNKHASKKLRAGRETVGKTAVVGVKDRRTNRVNAAVVEATDAPTLQGFCRGAHRGDGHGLHRRGQGLYWLGPAARRGQALGGGICAGDGAHQRGGVLLGLAETGLHRDIPPLQPQASASVYQRV